MSDYVPDPIERGEARAEAWADENLRGDSFKCACGQRVKLSEAQTISADPYAPPYCGECADKYYLTTYGRLPGDEQPQKEGQA